MSDGRPMLNLSCRDLAATILDIDERCLIIPAHSWTPWFGFYGARGGFDSLDDAFKDYAKYIYAVETGLGSDPAMNWRIGELDDRNIVSFSDAHSLPKIGREATVFEVPELSYKNIREAIIEVPDIWLLGNQVNGKLTPDSRTHRDAIYPTNRIAYTIEFYRQEGKYHFTGHRKCGVSHSPEQSRRMGFLCPVCGKKLTVGAMQRTEDLASRNEKCQMINDKLGVRWVHSNDQKWRPPFVNLVPLQEILGEVFKVGVQSKKVQTEYERLVSILAPEYQILLDVELKDIEKVGDKRLKEAIEKVRSGNIFVKPGFDGVFGVVKIWPFDSAQGKPNEVVKPRQEGLF